MDSNEVEAVKERIRSNLRILIFLNTHLPASTWSIDGLWRFLLNFGEVASLSPSHTGENAKFVAVVGCVRFFFVSLRVINELYLWLTRIMVYEVVFVCTHDHEMSLVDFFF